MYSGKKYQNIPRNYLIRVINEFFLPVNIRCIRKTGHAPWRSFLTDQNRSGYFVEVHPLIISANYFEIDERFHGRYFKFLLLR